MGFQFHRYNSENFESAKTGNYTSSIMKSFAIATIIALAATLASAAPSASLEARQSTPNRPVSIEFVNPDGAEYSLTETADGSTFFISMFSSSILTIRTLSESKAFYTDRLIIETTTGNPLPISVIEIGPGGYGAGFVNLAGCVFYGADGSVTRVGDNQNVDVSPPQPQVNGSCSSFAG